MGVKTGLNGLAGRITGLERRRLMRQAGRQAAGRLMELAAARTPVEGGTLRDSWRIGEPEETGRGVCVEVRNEAEYASFVEEGHRQTPERFIPVLGKVLVEDFVPGRFFLRAAAAQYRAERDAGLQDLIDRSLRQVMRDDR